uniref:IMP dehydrogenase/GMP reductase, related n=1 Tax=Medicago truncatula TaxID=3880 RepID=Q2HUW4_MEDTR|nr:IMP dehydrogenase/GMP reductase, related [Medicago truncatula]
MLDHDAVVDWSHGITHMTRLLGMSDDAACAESKSEYGSHISYPTLKRLYKEHLTVARDLHDPQTREERLERHMRRSWCVRSFLLYLVGSALFTNKMNRDIHLIYLDCMTHLDAIGKWSWGGMTLAYLYDYFDDYVRLLNKTMDGCGTLLMGWILEHLAGSYPRKKNNMAGLRADVREGD